MTSLLPKKPPITASPTPRTRANSPSRRPGSRCRPKSLGRCVAVVFWTIAALIALILLIRPDPAAAAESQVKTVSYTTGKTGSTLKWLPIRPADAQTVKQAGATEDLPGPSSSPSKGPTLSSPADAFADPFGDSKKKTEPSPAAGLSQEGLKPTTANGSPGAGLKPSSQAKQLLLPAPDTAKPADKQPEELAAGEVAEPSCPKKGALDRDMRDVLKSVPVEVSVPKRTGREVSKERPRYCVLEPRDPVDRSTWERTTFTWNASALCHKPAYFEDESVERYGHTYGPWFQPIVSGGHFFLTVPIMPYLMGLYPPHECVYTLGYYRPGSCAPFTLDPLPLSLRAAIAEGGVWTGMVFLIP